MEPVGAPKEVITVDDRAGIRGLHGVEGMVIRRVAIRRGP